MKKDNKNVAIGKSEQLANTLRWLPKDDHYWRFDKKISIRNLFIERMGELLPRKASNPRLFNHILLPRKVGGYGLGFPEEYLSALLGSPEPTQYVLSLMLLGVPVPEDLKILRSLNTNVSTRGVEEIQEFEQDYIIDMLNKYPASVNAITWKELKQKFPSPNDNAKETVAIAADAGWLSPEDFAKRCTRGLLFQKLIMGESKLKVFNTRRLVDQYKHVWGRLEDRHPIMDGRLLPDDLNSAMIAKAIEQSSAMWFFDINQIDIVDVGYCDPDFSDDETWVQKDVSFIQNHTEGYPNLIVGKKFVGVRV